MEKKPYFGPRPPRPAAPADPKGPRRPVRGQKPANPNLIKEQIRAREVRLVGDNVETGIYSIHDALKKAEELELDLVEISPTAQPPVCKILDYQKYLYQQKKKQKEIKAKATKVVIKEIRFGPQTDDHDYNFKLKHAMGFLQEGSKVKPTSSSKAARFSSKSRARFSSSVSQTTSKTTAKWSRCPSLKESA